MSTTAAAAVPMEAVKQNMKAMWMAGDFGMIAKNNEAAAEAFVHGLGMPLLGKRALDVACGTGNVAIPLARAGASVTGVDIATNLLEQARQRAKAEGLAAHFDEGDAEALPYADNTFDLVTSMFGAMFAPRPELMASEAARVLKPGGLLAMANWPMDSLPGEMFRAGSKFSPPPAGLEPPALWGERATVETRLKPHFDDVRTERVVFPMHMPKPPREVVQFFRMYFGPTQTLFQRLDPDGQAGYARALEEIFAKYNRSEDPEHETRVEMAYTKVTGLKR